MTIKLRRERIVNYKINVIRYLIFRNKIPQKYSDDPKKKIDSGGDLTILTILIRILNLILKNFEYTKKEQSLQNFFKFTYLIVFSKSAPKFEVAKWNKSNQIFEVMPVIKKIATGSKTGPNPPPTHNSV